MINIYFKTTCLKCNKEEIIKDNKYYLPPEKSQVYEMADPHFNQFDELVKVNYPLLAIDGKLNCLNCKEPLYMSFISMVSNETVESSTE